MNIASLLTAMNDMEQPALIFSAAEKSAVTFRELDDLSSRLAAGFDAEGLRAGDRVIILTSISLSLYASLIALFKLGTTVVFLDPQTGYKQLNHAIELADARAFIGTRKALWLKCLLPALRCIPHLFLSEGDGMNSLQHMGQIFSPLTSIAEVDDDAPALITFTGGSTGISPHGVLRTHRLLFKQHRALSRILPTQTNDVDLPAFPVATLHNLASGITSVIPDFSFRRPDAVQPEKILHQIETHRITTASGSPAYWTVIMRHCLQNRLKLNLRCIVTGGAPTVPALMQQLSRVAPNAEIINLYGSSEAEPVAKLSVEDVSDEMIRRIETGSGIPLGRPVVEVCVRIVDENHVEQSANHVGEIWVSGGHVARGYFSNPDADAINKYLDADGKLWHRMGDVGYQDDDGWLWLVGRINTVIVHNGKPLYPIPLETVIGKLPFVQRAALVGAVDDLLGGIARARLFVEFSEDISLPKDWRAQIESLLLQCDWVVDEICPIHKIPVDARHNSRIDYVRLKSRR